MPFHLAKSPLAVETVINSSATGSNMAATTPTKESEQIEPPGTLNEHFGASWRRARLTAEQRIARGRDARTKAPRSAHAHWEPATDRPDPVTLLEEQSKDRVAELIPIRYGRMLVSPFTFFRGAATIMAADLAPTPVSGVTVQLCGDAHLSNFGLFGTPERRMLFDINDFDETLPGPWEWDVKRLAASFEILGRDRGFSPADRRAIVMAGVREYRDRMRHAAGIGSPGCLVRPAGSGHAADAGPQQEVSVKRLTKQELKTAKRQEMVAKAQTRDSIRVFAKRAHEVDGELRIVADPPLIVPIEDLVVHRNGVGRPDPADQEAAQLLPAHPWSAGPPAGGVPLRPCRPQSRGRGQRRYALLHLLLLMGRDDNDPLFLQVKEANASVLERFLGSSSYQHHGERVVVGQRLMQAATDIFLGWQRIKGLDGVTRDYYVRQFHDWKGGAERRQPAACPAPPCTLASASATLARAHARWGDRIAIASYLGKGDAFDKAIAEFSAALRRPERARLRRPSSAAVKSGRLIAPNRCVVDARPLI